MPREFNRADRVADFIKRELSVLLQHDVRDPRVKNANVNAVAVSRDMSVAKVYVTFWGAESDDEAADAVKVLNGAAGYLRSQLAAMHSMRSTPRLQFYFDSSVRTGEHMSKLIAEAVASDRKNGSEEDG